MRQYSVSPPFSSAAKPCGADVRAAANTMPVNHGSSSTNTITAPMPEVGE